MVEFPTQARPQSHVVSDVSPTGPMTVVPDQHVVTVMMDEGPNAVGANNDKQSITCTKSKANPFKGLAEHRRVRVDFSDVCAYVPVLVTSSAPGAGKCMSCFRNGGEEDGIDSSKERQILFGVTGCVEPGEVLALMGPSGSGKSSLLTLLAARSTATLKGTINFNGERLTKRIQRRMGYVSQDDMLYEQLTVYETLYYAAMLRLPSHWSRATKLARVDLVIDGLGLAKCKGTIIGNRDMRGVSGGERKRASIGHELLINPAVLLLDEPTSGLDSTTALKLMHTLRTLASGGRTIISSIHQPASRMYMMVDKLLLLSDGHTLYYGDAHSAAPWFDRLGCPLPYGESISDHILDLACGDFPGMTPELGRVETSRLIEAFKSSKEGAGKHGIQAEDVGLEVQNYNTQVHRSATMGAGLDMDMIGEDEDEDDDSKWGATWMEQFMYLASRSTRTRRFTSLSTQKIVELVTISAVSGLFWWQLGDEGSLDTQRAKDIGGLIFYMVLFMSFSNMFVAIFTFPSEMAMLIKERQSGMYRLSAYYLARLASDIPMDCLLPSLFNFILYFMAGLRLDAGAFFAFWWALMLSMFLAQSMGLLIGASVTNPKSALTTCSIVMLLTMLIAGFYVEDSPGWIDWMKYLSFIYYGWNLLLKIQFNGTNMADTSECDPPPPPGEPCSVADAEVFLVDVNASPGLEIGVLIGMLIFWRACVYLTLRWKTTFKTKLVK